MGKETVECLFNLREKEGKTAEITQAGVDLLRPPGSVDIDAFRYAYSRMLVVLKCQMDGMHNYRKPNLNIYDHCYT